MRPARLLLILALVSLTAFSSAAAAQISQARFAASLTATVTKKWTYSSTRVVNACTAKTNGSGTRTISMRSTGNSVVRTSWAGKGTRVKFPSSVRLIGGVITQSGSKTTQNTGPSACDKSIHKLTCARISRSFKNQVARPISRRIHRVSFLPMKDLVPDDFFNDCPGEPSAVRSVAGGLDLAGSTLSETELFDRSVGSITLQGSADAETQTLSGAARVVQHVNWRLSLRRLGG